MKQRTSRVRRLCYFVRTEGPSGALGLRGLLDRPTWARWLRTLHLSLKPTTVANHFWDYTKFLTFIKLLRPSGVGLTLVEIERIQNIVLTELNALKPAVAEHRLESLEQKSSVLLTPQDMDKFLSVAKDAMPDALCALDTDPGRAHNYSKVLGLISAYLLTITGCRISCISGLKAFDVTSAVSAGADGGQRGPYKIVRLGRHKTSRTYGPAKVALTSEEHGWLLRYLNIRARIPGYRSASGLFFFNSSGKQHAKITTHIKTAYQRLIGRPGVTALGIRTAVANLARRAGSPLEQVSLMQQMAHGPRARDCYYIAPDSGPELINRRRVLERGSKLRESPVVTLGPRV